MTERISYLKFRKGERGKRKKPTKIRKSAYRSKLEMRYSGRLKLQFLDKRIKGWTFEPDKLQITFGNEPEYYIPDFRVTNLDGTVDYHETKCARFKKNGKWKTPMKAKEGLLKLKIAADLYPDATFYLVEWIEGQWIMTEIKSRS